jgi:hypothetical protein
MDGVLGQRFRWSKGALLGVFAWLALAGPVTAAPARVAVVREAEPNALEQATLTRLRAELVAAGFEVTEVERGSGDAREATEAEPQVAGVFATIAIVSRTADAADLWVADRVTGKTLVRRIRVPPGSGRDAATILAVRAVELLQASLLEAFEQPEPVESTSSLAPPPPVAVVPTDVSAWMQARRPPSQAARFALQAGAGVIHSLGGVGPALLPVLGVGFRPTPDLSIGLRAGGPAFAADLQVPPAGTIAVRQKLVSLEVAYELLSPTATVRPVAIGGVGAYHLDVVGTAAAPYSGETDDVFAAMATLGPGAKLRFGERVSIFADLRLLFIAPRPIVRAALQEVGSMSRPSLFGEVVIDVAF